MLYSWCMRIDDTSEDAWLKRKRPVLVGDGAAKHRPCSIGIYRIASLLCTLTSLMRVCLTRQPQA